MRTTRLCTFSQRHFVWLLWLALLFPLGQIAASWHVLSHVHSSQAADNDDQQEIHQDRCDLCLSAEILIGGTLLAYVPDAQQARAHVELPLLALHDLFSIALTRAYNSRAPPFSTH